MKRLIVIAVVSILMIILPAFAYDIDGDLSDWDLDLVNASKDWEENQTWIPKTGVRFLVEDNADPRYKTVGGYVNTPHAYGVHIVSSPYSPYFKKYNEPLIQAANGRWYVQPSGGEKWDVEAIYLDENQTHIFVAIVLSIPENGYDWHSRHLCPGDLALNLDGDNTTGGHGFEYGVKLSTCNSQGEQFAVYYTPNDDNWTDPESDQFPINAPARVNMASNPTKVGEAIGVYTALGRSDQGVENYVIELAINKSDVGVSGSIFSKPVDKLIHLVEASCGNDYLDIPISVPEFLSMLVPLGIIVGSVFYFRKRAG